MTPWWEVRILPTPISAHIGTSFGTCLGKLLLHFSELGLPSEWGCVIINISRSSAFMLRILAPLGGTTGLSTSPGWRIESFCASRCKFWDSGNVQRSLFWRLENRDDDLRNLLCGKIWSTGLWAALLQLVSPLPAKWDQSGSWVERCSNANSVIINFLRVCYQVLLIRW